MNLLASSLWTVATVFAAHYFNIPFWPWLMIYVGGGYSRTCWDKAFPLLKERIVALTGESGRTPKD